MKAVYTKKFPFKGYKSCLVFGILFVRKENKWRMRMRDWNHEEIHARQGRELLWIPYYLLYGAEYLFRLVQYRNHKQAYRNISFEREAYSCEAKRDYLAMRKRFASFNYLTKKK